MAKDDKQPQSYRQRSLFGEATGRRNRPSLGSEEDRQPAEDLQDEEIITVGSRLREAREAKGFSLHQVAEILRLRATQVQALEEGEYDRLPGQAFVTGFLRSYANLVDLDAVAIVDLYKQEGAGGLRAPSLAFPEPTSGGRIPGGGLLLGTFVLALVLLAGWILYQESENLDFERVAELPENLAKKIQDNPGIGNSTDTNNTSDMVAIPRAEDASKPEAVTENSGSSAGAAMEQAEKTSASDAVTADESEKAAAKETAAETTASTAATEAAAPMPADTTDKAPPAQAAATESGTVASEASEKAPAISGDFEKKAEKVEEKVAAAVAAATTTPVPQKTETDAPADTASAPAKPAPKPAVVASYPQSTLTQPAAQGESGEDDGENPLPRTFGVENTDARVVLRAREESWIEIRAAADKPIISRLLRPGDVYMAPNEPDLKLTTGNAGGLEIRVDGHEISSLGARGAILRDLPLVADSLLGSGNSQ